MEKNPIRKTSDNSFLSPEDYSEPRCLLCGDPYGAEPEVRPVPLQRILSKVDEFQSRKDFPGAERVLNYWLEEAKLGNDLKGQLGIRNEFIGLYRKNDKKEKTFENIEEALKLLEELEFDGSISSGTTYTNAATGYYSFGEYEKALPLFEKALTVYVASPGTNPSLLGGLYNNMGLACAAMKRFERAESLYKKALSVMENVEGGMPERAITYLNMADLLDAEKGIDDVESEIFPLLDQAEQLLDQAWEELSDKSENEKGYYAFVCESCAPTFSYYGYFMTAAELNKRAQSIYEQNKARS